MTEGSVLGHLAVSHSHTPVSYREQTLTYSTRLGWERGQQLPPGSEPCLPGEALTPANLYYFCSEGRPRRAWHIVRSLLAGT